MFGAEFKITGDPRLLGSYPGWKAGRTGALERPDGRYVGELHFQVEYDGQKGEPFPQLYVTYLAQLSPR